MLHYVVTRLKEPSTFAGLSGLALAFGVSTDLYNAVAAVVAAVAGLVAVILADKAE
jgi:hypothetical protein